MDGKPLVEAACRRLSIDHLKEARLDQPHRRFVPVSWTMQEIVTPIATET